MLISLDSALKIVQIGFFTLGGILAILTYIKAKNTLLNSVNTEYQKRVIQRLGEVSEELLTELDPKSPHYWAKTDSAKEVLDRFHIEAKACRDEIIRTGHFSTGIPVSEEELAMDRIIIRIKSDPFIPRKIREKVHELFDNRLRVMRRVYVEEVERYQLELSQGKHWDNIDDNHYWFHNRIIDRLYEQGCGISQIEKEIHNLRIYIQEYLESFDPFKK